VNGILLVFRLSHNFLYRLSGRTQLRGVLDDLVQQTRYVGDAVFNGHRCIHLSHTLVSLYTTVQTISSSFLPAIYKVEQGYFVGVFKELNI